tara:strand:- start:72 stop:173 length:102 start_codon:yes stop_codon:yes gene_type:complete
MRHAKAPSAVAFLEAFAKVFDGGIKEASYSESF